MNITIKYFLEWKEYFAAQEFFRNTRHEIAPEKLIGGLLLIVSSLWFLLSDLNLFAVIGLIAGLAMIFGGPLIRRFNSKRKWNREPLYHTEHTVSAGEDGVNYVMGKVESNLDWKYYQRMIESPDGFLLVYSNDSFNFLPKRAFADEDRINEFRALISKRLK